MIFFSEYLLRNTFGEYLIHYHVERNHQELDHQIIEQGEEVGQSAGEIDWRQRLGGLLNYYYRKQRSDSDQDTPIPLKSGSKGFLCY
mgnify:CR=1 FL=1|jgi:putative transposase